MRAGYAVVHCVSFSEDYAAYQRGEKRVDHKGGAERQRILFVEAAEGRPNGHGMAQLPWDGDLYGIAKQGTTVAEPMALP